MIPVPSGVRVWLAVGHTDMRRGMNGLALQVQEAMKRDPYDEVALYQELLAERRLNHGDRTAVLVKQFRDAKAHNQEAKTKYILQEASPPQ